jgi:hypothetical protein
VTPEELASTLEEQLSAALAKSPADYVREERDGAVAAVLDWFEKHAELVEPHRRIKGDLRGASAEICAAITRRPLFDP